MTRDAASGEPRALALPLKRELSGSRPAARSVGSTPPKHRQPPEGLTPEDVRAVIAAAATERDRLLRASTYGQAGEPAPVHPHLFRHARVRQIVRTTRSLPIAQKQAGWSRLQMAYLSVSDEEVREAMRDVRD